ncbi:MAG TPA: type II toxin-antitoxin system RelE/ParE family toxin [Pyrinomonadaceae bacterium]|nr:type II toxin-antitoxin system RelE/ParE family toxin [Pyrinomonadaceae bacterium]
MTYHVEISKEADKQISKLPKRDQLKVLNAIISLADNPRPHGYKKLEYYNEYFRYRVGNYRIIYQIRDKELFVFVVEVKKRDESTY